MGVVASRREIFLQGGAMVVEIGKPGYRSTRQEFQVGDCAFDGTAYHARLPELVNFADQRGFAFRRQVKIQQFLRCSNRLLDIGDGVGLGRRCVIRAC